MRNFQKVVMRYPQDGALRTSVALAIFSIPMPVLAQAGAGGAVSGIFWIFIWGIGIAALLAFLFIGRVFGAKAVAGALILIIGFIAISVVVSEFETRQRASQKTEIEASLVNECLSQGKEDINIKLVGKEKVSIAIVGQSKLPEDQKNLVLDISKMPKDFSTLNAVPADFRDENSVLVVLTYDRSELKGSPSGFYWEGSKISVQIHRASDGAKVASRRDIQLRQGFCLGSNPRQGLIEFLRQALSRPDIYNEETSSKSSQNNARHYFPVVASFDRPTKGVFHRTLEDRKPSSEVARTSELQSWLAPIASCKFEEVAMTSPIAKCAMGTEAENFFSLKDLIGIAESGKSWFAIFRHSRGIPGLATLKIEERDLLGKLVGAWIVNFPIPGEQVGFEMPEIAFDGNKATLQVHWGYESAWSDASHKERYRWYGFKSTIRFDLPETPCTGCDGVAINMASSK